MTESRCVSVNRCLALALSLAVVAGCVTESPKPKVAKTDGPGLFAQPQVYDCGQGVQFTVAFELNQAWLLLPNRTVKLTPTEAASGVQYQGEGVTFWEQGDKALLILPAERHTDCRVDSRASAWAKAKLQGVDFRAMGSEPGWYLEIYEGKRIVLVTDYGRKWHEFGAPQPQGSAVQGLTRYQTQNEGHAVTIDVRHTPCTDASGDMLEATVSVQLDQRVYHGCGRAL